MHRFLAFAMPLVAIVVIPYGAWTGGIVGLASVIAGALLWEFRPGLDWHE